MDSFAELPVDKIEKIDFFAWRVGRARERFHRQEVKHLMALRPRQRAVKEA